VAGRDVSNIWSSKILSGATETVSAAGLFVLIGADPHTGWPPEEIKRDERGYVVTGKDLLHIAGHTRTGWTYLARLKIRCPERGVSVRARPPVLISKEESRQQGKAPGERTGGFWHHLDTTGP